MALSGLTPNQQKLVTEYMTFASGIARNMQMKIPKLIEAEDAVSVAYVGLIEAARRFDPSKHDDGIGTMGQHFKNFAYKRIHGAILDETRRLSFVGRRDKEAGKKAKIESLDEMMGDSDLPMRPLADLEATPWLRVDLQHAMEGLTEREQLVMWGFAFGTTGKEIGEQMGVTESRVSQIATIARAKLALVLEP
jgi:RNA polymerase sigma factor (sigma-70 family)